MGGHLFVLRGDLTQLRCSAILVPCDTDWKVVWKHWASLLPEDRFGPADASGWRPLKGGGTGRYTDVVTDRTRWVRLSVTATGRWFDTPQARASWVAEGVKDAIADLSTRDLPPVAGRVKPLIGLPLVATGDGGFEKTRGVLIHALVPALRKAARDHDVDIALVLIDQRDYAAVQAVRKPKYWKEFTKEQPHLAAHLRVADRLGRQAARGELSLFLGSGVSVPLGVPNWEDLLAKIGGRRFKDFDAAKAPEIAQRIEQKIGRRKLKQSIVANVDVDGVAPTHLLLAALAVVQNVTTNYDTAYERALDTSVGESKYRVLTGQLAQQPEPWLLKYHGCVTRKKTIVITSDDYKRLKKRYGALQAVVESLMMTSHLMFVGFSMADADFIKAARRVRAVRRLANQKDPPDMATVLALHPDAVLKQAGFKVVSMLDKPEYKQAARLLEIFLDRISWKAATNGPASSSYLLHPDYQDLFASDPPTMRLRELLGGLANKLGTDDVVCESSGWKQVADLLKHLGGQAADKQGPGGFNVNAGPGDVDYPGTAISTGRSASAAASNELNELPESVWP